nr:hypothetical protein JVH1_3092 [Rhodococcus sp. JVH1]
MRTLGCLVKAVGGEEADGWCHSSRRSDIRDDSAQWGEGVQSAA